MGKSVLHIKTEIECKVFLFDEEKGIASPGEYFNLEVRRGEQDLLFVNINDESIQYRLKFNVDESDSDYTIGVPYSLLDSISTSVKEEEVLNGVMDEYGVLYRYDGKYLIECRNGKLKDYTIKDGCRAIKDGAFLMTEEGSVELIPNSGRYYKTIEHTCSLSSIKLPNSLTHIGESAFSGCQELVEISFSDNLSVVGDYAFANCEKLSSIQFPESVNQIGEDVFYRCINLTNVVFRGHRAKIGKGAFSSCEKLARIQLPPKLKHIEECTFCNCTTLSEIAIPSSVEEIDNAAFLGCKRLTKVVLPKNLSILGNEVFACSGITEVTCNSSKFAFERGFLIDVEEKKLIACTSKDIALQTPKSINQIEDYAFKGNLYVQEITITGNVKQIGEGAFYKCENLGKVIICEGVERIGNDAFSSCNNLKEITIPSSIVSWGYLGRNIFNRLTAIKIPSGTRERFEGLFNSYSSLLVEE